MIFTKHFIVSLIFSCFILSPLFPQATKVEISKNEDGSFEILRGSEPYYIKGGATTNRALFPELAARGGNSVRTWGVDGLTRSLLNDADKNGLTVILGLWMKKEKDGFDYNDEVKVAEQLESFRYFVQQFKDHPALLGWSIGNEVDAGYTNLKVWNAVNDISQMIHQEDTNHITLTITINISVDKANALAERAPDLDLLGVNTYGGITSIRSNIAASNWEKPYIITEWGVNGPWEVVKTPWGAPLELNSTEKANVFLSRYQTHIDPYKTILPGSYAFYWNSKFEGTQTWFGMFVKNETTPMVDVMEYCWTGIWPENKAPDIQNLTINSKLQNQNVKITSKTNNVILTSASDPEGDSLEYEFLILPETGDLMTETIPGATYKSIPGIISQQENGQAIMQFQDIHNHLNLRLYALVRDGKGHIATATFPFQTDFAQDPTSAPFKNAEQNILKAWPNPANDVLYVNLGIKNGSFKLNIRNSTGQIIYSKPVQANVDKVIELKLNDYPPGIYILESQGKEGDFERLLFIIK